MIDGRKRVERWRYSTVLHTLNLFIIITADRDTHTNKCSMHTYKLRAFNDIHKHRETMMLFFKANSQNQSDNN